MSKQFLILGCCAALLSAAVPAYSQSGAAGPAYSQPGSPTPDAKFLPSITGKSTSIGNIYSPNLFDGSTNINIPIYDFSNDHGGFGVSFSYNTKGVRVDELAGRYGLHWALNAGGGISRVMKDLPDEINKVHDVPNGYTGQHMTSVGRWALYNITGTVPSNVQQDGENDDFIVSVGTLNFTFNIGKDGFIFTNPHRGVRIEKTMTFAGDPNFKITDESGNQYFFATAELADYDVSTYALTYQSLLHTSYVSRWVISKIIFAEGGQITYDYEQRFPPDITLYFNTEKRESVIGNTIASQAPNRSGRVPYSPSSGEVTQLKAIHYPNGITVTFNYDVVTPDPNPTTGNCHTPLKEIVVSSDTNNCTRFSMDLAYHSASFNTNSAVITEYSPDCNPDYDMSKRLILRGIRIKSCDGTLNEPYYSFEYATSRLPSRASFGMDRFGYNNGANPNDQIAALGGVPSHTFAGQTVGVNRNPATDVNLVAAASLVKVNNAYGGSVAFTYELHSGLQNVIPGLPADSWFLGKDDNDGLRIKTITETDKFHPGNARIKTFTYSGGQRFLTGGYYHFLSDMALSSGSWVPNYYTVGSYRISPLQLVNGSNHGYSQVNVESRDQSGNLFGRTEYVFSNLVTGTDTCLLNSGSRKYFEAPFTDRQYIKDWLVGLPIQTTEYDQNNLIQSRVTNTYFDTLDVASAAGLQNNVKTMKARRGGNNTDPFDAETVATDTYLPYTGKALLVSTLSEKYVSSTNKINDVVNYGYDNRGNLKWTKTRNSRGIYTLTENTYNYDAVEGSNPGGTTGLGNLYTMTGDKLEKLVSTERWNLGTSGQNVPGNKRLLDASITGLEYANGSLRTKSLYVLQTGNPITYADYTGVSTTGPVASRYNKIRSAYSDGTAASFQKASEVQLFDTKGNPLETKLLDLSSYKAMLWDTATGNKLADVSNARYNEIAFTSFEPGSYTPGTTITDGRVTYSTSGLGIAPGPLGAISGNKAYAFSSLNPAAITIVAPPAGKSYILSFWSRSGIPAVYAANSGLTPVALYSTNGWTYYEVKFTSSGSGTVSLNGQGSATIYVDEVRLFPADAMMQNWTYKPLCGATSSTDAAGRITYYEYDKLGRPRLVRNQEGQILSRTSYTIN